MPVVINEKDPLHPGWRFPVIENGARQEIECLLMTATAGVWDSRFPTSEARSGSRY